MLSAYTPSKNSGPNIGTGGIIPVTNPAENQIRPIALARKNALFAGNAVGAENGAMPWHHKEPSRFPAEGLRVALAALR